MDILFYIFNIYFPQISTFISKVFQAFKTNSLSYIGIFWPDLVIKRFICFKFSKTKKTDILDITFFSKKTGMYEHV